MTHFFQLAALMSFGDTLGAAVPTLLQYVLAPTIPALGAGLLWLIVHGAALLRTKANGNKVMLALATGVDWVSNAVKTVVDQLAPEIQAALANDGVIDVAEKAKLRADALALVTKLLPAPLQSILTSQFGQSAMTWVQGQVSAALDKHLDTIASSTTHSVAADRLPPQQNPPAPVAAPAPTRP